MQAALFKLIASLACIFPPLTAYNDPPKPVQLVEITNPEIKNLVYGIAERHLELEKSTYTIQEHSAADDMAEGGSKSTIYYIVDQTKTPLYVIKLREISNPNNLREWNEEWESLTKFYALSNQTFYSVKPIAKTQITLNEKVYGAFIEEKAKGTCLSSTLKSYYLATDETEKERLFTTLKNGLKKAGSALAKLHRSTKMSSISHYYANRFNEIQKSSGKTLYKTLPGPFSYTHGDAHIGNIFYDEEKDFVTFIDLGNAHPSFEGGPSGDDLALTLISIEMFGFYYGLSELQVIELSDTFLDSYRSSGGLDVSDDTIELYYALFALNLAKTAPEGLNPMEKSAVDFAAKQTAYLYRE